MSVRARPMGGADPHGHLGPTRCSLLTPAQSAPNPIRTADPALPRPTPTRPPRPCMAHIWPRVARERARGASGVAGARPTRAGGAPPALVEASPHPLAAARLVRLVRALGVAAQRSGDRLERLPLTSYYWHVTSYCRDVTSRNV